jgi:hypothetical protein
MKQPLALTVLIVLTLACGSFAPTVVPTEIPPTAAAPTLAVPTATVDPALIELTLTFVNNSAVPLDYYWVNYDAKEENFGIIDAGRTVEVTTYFEQLWRIRDQTGNLVTEYSVTKDSEQTVNIEADAVAAADPVATDLSAQVQKFNEEGRIPTTDGEYINLEDFSDTFSQIGYYQAYPIGIELENFVFIGHLKWSTATVTSDNSACGILFGGQPDNSDYAVFLDKSRVYFSSSTARNNYELGKTSGTGRINFGNPAEADFSLVVYQTHAYVYVDGKFIGEYTLSKDKPLKGSFGYGIISGTNKDYGTSCEITNAGLWSLK